MPPPGWVEPVAPPPFAAPERVVPSAGDIRTENRRLLDSRRLLARLVDWLLIYAVAQLVCHAWDEPFAEFAFFQCVLLTYSHVFEVTTGATLGKRLFGLRVASLDTGGLPSPRQAATRGVIGIVEIGLIAAIAIIATKQRRRLGDYAAGTAVVDARKHPIPARGFTARAAVYPLLWLIPTLVVCLPVATGAPRDPYTSRVNYLCARADADVGAALSYGGAETVPAMLDRRNQLIAAQVVPGEWRDRHRALLVALERQTEVIRRASRDPELAREPGRLVATALAQRTGLRGYEYC